jgi:putative phage-type endonuclease
VSSLQEDFDRTAQVTAFGAACHWSGVRDDNRSAWLAERQKYLTASDIAGILGEDRRNSPFKVYWDKIQPTGADDAISIESPMFWGKVLEQPILSAVADYYGWSYRRGGALLVSRKYPWLACTLDAEIDRGKGYQEPFEGKTTSFMLRGDWDQETGDAPNRVFIQVQTQLLVTEAECAPVFCLVGGQGPVLVNIEPEPEIHAIIVEESERFMDAVKSRQEPPPGPEDGPTLDRIYPDRGEGVVQLSGVAMDWSREIISCARDRKVLEAREKELKNAIKRSIGKATWGKLPDDIEGLRWWKWYLNQNAIRLLKNGPKIRGALPIALPVAMNESPVIDESEHTETTKAPAKKRRKARR